MESVPTESEPVYLRFGGNWFHIIFWRIVLEAAQILRESVPHYFLADCFGGSSELAGTGFTLFSEGLFSRQLRHGLFWDRFLLDLRSFFGARFR